MRVTAGLVAASLAACGGGGGDRRPTPEGEIAEELGRQLGVPVERVRCPAGAYPKTCTAEVIGTEGLSLTVTETTAGLAWTLSDFVISTAPLAVQIAIELDDLGVEAEVDCGARLRVTRVGDRFQCALRGDVDGAALVTITDEEANFALELALGADAVAARTTPADRAALERLSRSLEAATAPTDAGVDAPPEPE